MMQQIEVIQAPPAPGQPAPTPAPTGTGGGLLVQTPGGVVHLPGGASPRAVLRGAEAKRERLGDLMSRLRNRRDETSRKLQDGRVTGPDRAGLEKYIQELDARIIDIEHQMQQAEHELAAAAAVPGAQIPERIERGGGRDFPEELIAIPIVFTIFVLFPIAIAFARRIWKRTGTAIAQTPAWMNERFSRMEQAVDAIAIEVERISEGQRFMTKLFSEGGRSLGQGAAEPVEVRVREHAPQGTT
jgi:hypothetical protein